MRRARRAERGGAKAGAEADHRGGAVDGHGAANELLDELKTAREHGVEGVDSLLLQRVVLHAADIGHPLRPWAVHVEWSRRAMSEFFAQGDEMKRRGLAPLAMFDLEVCMPGKSQVGFLKFVVVPTYELLGDFLGPRVETEFKHGLRRNSREWELIPRARTWRMWWQKQSAFSLRPPSST